MTTSPMLHNCFVGMFDIIGFQALRKNIGTIGLHQRFIRGILPAIEHSAAGGGKSILKEGVSFYVPVISKSSVECRIISDSVIFIVRDDSFESFMNIVHSSFMLVQFGFSGLKAPYRGAIGWGDLIIDNNILVGSAIEDAHIGESSQVWAGAMLTDACQKFAVEKDYIKKFGLVNIALGMTCATEAERSRMILNALRLVEYPVPIQARPC